MGGASSSERRARQQQQPHTVRQQPSPQYPPAQHRPNPGQYPGQYPQQHQHHHGGPPPGAHQYPPAQQQQQFRPPQQAPQSPPGQAVSEAQSIKNEATVMVESVKYDRASSVLKFTTNANIPFELEVHVAVRVDLMHGSVMITPNKPKAPPPKVPVPAGERTHEVPIDLSNVSEQEMKFLQEYPRQFPCVITLYYDAPDDKDNHCAEYTMVQLAPEGKFVKQLLRTKAGVFKIENLFGGEHADVGTVVEGGNSPQPEGGATEAIVETGDDDDGLCVICLTNEKNTVVIPCRHLCLCKECAEELRNRAGQKCPVCRGPLHQLVAVKQ